MKITVYRPVKKQDKWDLEEHEEERELVNTDGREFDLCVVCGFPPYPECTKTCSHFKLLKKQKAAK